MHDGPDKISTHPIIPIYLIDPDAKLDDLLPSKTWLTWLGAYIRSKLKWYAQRRTFDPTTNPDIER